MSDYTPTTEEVREGYATHRFNAYAKYREVGLPEFDRWLERHDAEVYQRGREDAAHAAVNHIYGPMPPSGGLTYIRSKGINGLFAVARGDGAE